MTELDKWPRLVVVGDNVLPEQADELIVRTTDWHLCTNDHAFARDVYALLGVTYDAERASPNYADIRRLRAELNTVPVSYLQNSRVASSWIGGSHGWCDWDGTIGCANYNVGKWPSVNELTDEWRLIARAFPYLDLTAQVVNGVDAEEPQPVPAATWVVNSGFVSVDRAPTSLLAEPRELSQSDYVVLGSREAERGVTLERIRTAVERVRSVAKIDAIRYEVE